MNKQEIREHRLKYIRQSRDKHLKLRAEALKLEREAFEQDSDELWEKARHTRHESMDYVMMRHWHRIYRNMYRVCRRTGELVRAKYMVYLAGVGNISEVSLTDTEKQHGIWCHVCNNRRKKW